MQTTPALIALAAFFAGAALLIRGSQAQGSGAGVVTTDDTNEGSIFDFGGIMNQITDAATPAPQDNPTTLSQAGLAALQNREGFSAKPYADHKGYSIGYGHLIKEGENLTYVSVAQALDLLASDVQWAQDAVLSAITVPITQNQFDALVSFAYNVGAGAFKRSTLVKRINAGDSDAGQEFGRWVYASSQKNQGLIARRQSERQQFESSYA